MRELFTNTSIDNVGRMRVSMLRTGVSVAALACLSVAAPAWAQTDGTAAAPSSQDAETQDEAEIVVQGYRQSLQSAQALKRNSDVIVDSVTAEDIGALPDRSVTEALQRIPGVSINRFAAGVDPDHFSVEGSGVVVRGLTYVRSEFNGREAFSASNGRALGFADVPSELLGGVDVFKTPSADRIEGGIAGVVNLRTRKPFDGKGLVLAASIENNYGDFVDKSSPTVSVLASNRWQTGIGEFGVLGSFVYSQLFSRADRLQLSSFRVRNLYSDGDVNQNGTNAVTGRVLFPRGAVMGTQEFNRERYGYSAAAQWRSNDGSMEAVFQFLRSDARQAWTERNIEIATDNVSSNGDSRRVPGTTLNFEDDGMFDSGLITGPTGWRGDQNTAGNIRTPAFGLQSNNIRRDHYEKMVTDDYGFNFKWDVSERFGLTFDYQHVNSTGYVIDNGLWTSSYQYVGLDLNGNDLPTVQFAPPVPCLTPTGSTATPCTGTPGSSGAYPSYFSGTHQSFADPYNTFYRSAMDHIEDSEAKSDAFRLDGEFSFPDNSFIKSIRAGVRYADRDQINRFTTYNWGRLSEQWGNDGPVWLDDPVDGIAGGSGGAPLTGYEAYEFPDFFRGQVANPIAGQPRLFYSGNTAKNYDAYVAYGRQINREWEAPVVGPDGVTRQGWTGLYNRFGVVAGTPFRPNEINPLEERNYAAYAMARFGTEFSGGVKLSGNIGLRYTKTKRAAEGGFAAPPPNDSYPTEAQCNVTANIPTFCFLTLTERNAARTFANNNYVQSTARFDYEYWLPSFNAKLEVGGGLQFRAAYFKGVTPPSTGLTRNFFNAAVGPVQNANPDGTLIPNSYRLQGTFGIGNPYLRPTEADSFDLTAEWYFSPVGQFTVSGFYKRLKNVLTNSTYRQDVTNNGATVSSVISQPINSSETGKIKGVEVAYQQTFDFLPGIFKGLGLQANYTFIDSQGVPQNTLSETDPDVAAGRVTTIDIGALPLQGLSKHAFNITPFIDIGKLSMRATYSWRSDFLLTIRDVIFPNDPIMNKAGGQLDASIFLAVTPNFKLGAQGVNLLNQITRTTAVVAGPDGSTTEVPRGWYINDRRFTLIARFNF